MTGERLSGTVDWVEGVEVGLRFDEAADVFALVARNLVRQPGDARRMPRIELRCSAMLQAGSRSELATIHDVSDGGCKIETSVPLVPHEQVEITLEDFHPVQGQVRWVQGNIAGICFTPSLSWQDLMPWLRQRKAGARSAETTPIIAPSAPAETVRHDAVGLSLPARVREGTRRWVIEVESIDTRQVRFTSYAALEPGRLFWLSLPGLEGWPARIVEIEGYSVTCAFTQPLHPAVLERILSLAKATPRR